MELSTFENETCNDYGDLNAPGNNCPPLLVFSLEYVWLVTAIYVLLFITGFTGNFIICTVIASKKSMHTTTNYYLFSLAISDIIILLSNIPVNIYFFWTTKDPYEIRLAYFLIAETASDTSIFTVTVLTVERYMAICRPLSKHSLSNVLVVKKHIAIIWCVSFCMALSLLVLPEIFVTIRTITAVVSTILFFFVPILVMSVLYVAIGIKLYKRKQNEKIATKVTINETRIIKMLVCILIVFVVCWSPFYFQRILIDFFLVNYDTNHILFAVSNLLYMSSATFNPILYSLMSHKFREELKDVFEKVCLKKVEGKAGNVAFKKSNKLVE